MDSRFPTYQERLPELEARLRKAGWLAIVLIDVSELTHVEHDYGSRAFEQVLTEVSGIVEGIAGRVARASDVLALDGRDGNSFLMFLAGRRQDALRAPRIGDLHDVAARVAEHLDRRIAWLSSPYLRRRCTLAVGCSVAFHNPLIVAERVVARLVHEAWESVRVQRAEAEFQARTRLQDALLGDEITTVFQPVVDLQQGGVLGVEALSRGPLGSPYRAPIELFRAADRADLVFELDRHCRQLALATARALPAPQLLFLNVVPAAMYDPDFRGPELTRLLERLGLPPERIVFEVSEQFAIENYGLFTEALEHFERMGFKIAVDDMGAGYSGLEKIARLDPRYLKIDLQLVRDIDRSVVKQEMARALKGFADRMGSSIIAEGIETEGERRVCAELGIHYGQGFLLGAPAALGEPGLARPAAKGPLAG